MAWQVINLGSSFSFPAYITAGPSGEEPYWEQPIIVPVTPALTLPAEPVLETPIAPYQEVVYEEPAEAKTPRAFIVLGIIALLYLAFKGKASGGSLSDVGYAPSPWERRRGKRIMFMWDEGTGSPKTISRRDAYARRGRTDGKVYALYAYSADHARELIQAGQGALIYGDDLAKCEGLDMGKCEGLELGGITCVHTEGQKSSEVDPKYAPERRALLEKYGKDAFLIPEGTPAKPGVPAYAVIDKKDGCFSCSLARMQYTRIGQAINKRDYPAGHKTKLRQARRWLIQKAASFADKSDKKNACNWAFRAAKTYNVPLSGLLEGPRAYTKSDLSREEWRVLMLLQRGPTEINELVKRSSYAGWTVKASLKNLEKKGLVEKTDGYYRALVGTLPGRMAGDDLFP